MLEAVVEFPGIESIVSFSYSMGQGVQPSTMSMVILPQDTSKIKLHGLLELSYGGQKRKMKNVLVDAASFRYDSGGGSISLVLKDYRWTWAFSYVTGAYNLRTIDGEPMVLGGAGVNDNDVLGNSKRSLRDLCKICLDAMGVKGKRQNVNDVPDNLYPPVSWDNENAANALHSLLEQFDLRLAPTWNGGANIVKVGVGAKLPASEIDKIESEGAELDPQERPEFIRLVTNPILYSVDFELEAVGEDVDGKIKLVEDCSWYSADLINFADSGEIEPDMSEDLEGADVEYSLNALAQKTCYKWWRIKLPRIGGAGAKGVVSGAVSPNKALHAFKDKFGQIKYIEQFLPLVSELPDMYYDTEAKVKTNKRAFVFGRFERDGDLGEASVDDVADIDFYTVDEPDPGAGENQRRAVVPVSFSLDQERGIVMFSSPVYALTNAGDPEKATLWLRAGSYIKELKTALPSRIIEERKEDAGSSAKYMTIPVDEAEPWFSVTGVDNHREIDKIIKRYDDEISEMFERREAEVATYIGLVFEPIDGAIREISWTIDEGGATTIISRNTDRSRRGTLGYIRRNALLEDKIARAKANRLTAVALWNARRMVARARN